MSETLTAPIKRVNAGTVVGFLVFVEFASGFTQGYYLPLIPTIRDIVGVSDADITWFVTLQTLAAAVSVPILAKLGDIFGHRRMLRIAIAAVFLGTVLIALAPNFAFTLVGRVIQGPLAVWLPLEIALVHSRIKGEAARSGVGLLVSSLTIGVIVGGLLGGFAGRLFPNTTVVLLIPAIVLGLCLVIVMTLIPESTTRATPRIDTLGFVLIAAFMLTLLIGLRIAQSSGFGHIGTIVLLVVAIALLVGFILWELRVEVPAIDVRMVGSRALAPMYLTALIFGMVLFGTQSITTTFLAANPGSAGFGFALGSDILSLFTAGTAVLGAVGAASFAFLARRLGIKTVLLTGVALSVLGNVLLAAGWVSLPIVIIAFCLNGVGTGFLMGALPAEIAEIAPADQTGIATGLYNSLRTLGGSIAGATFGVILSLFTTSRAVTAGIGGYVTVWIVCAALFALGFLALALLMQRPNKTTHKTSEVA